MNEVSLQYLGGNVIGYLSKILSDIAMIIKFKKKYKNYFYVLRKYRKREFPITATLLDGSEVILHNRMSVLFEIRDLANFFIINDKELRINKEEFRTIKFENWEDNGDFIGVFVEEEYKTLSFKNKIVIDVGANIGDSSLYFALKGAKHVIAIEPFFENYNALKRNIEINDLEAKITPIYSGCGSSTRNVKTTFVDTKGIGLDIKEFEGGKNEIKIIGLDELVSKYPHEKIVLKLDCEGCEYDTIINSNEEILKKIDEIILEYHSGYKKLKNKLTSAKFSVKIFDVKRTTGLGSGMLLATK
jgi:FkbM family methyltransferase